VWHYRIYDTVNDPNGSLRALLATNTTLIEERRFSGAANMLVQGYLSGLHQPEVSATEESADVGDHLRVHVPECCGSVKAGSKLYPLVYWDVGSELDVDVATSIRLVDDVGRVWSQPVDSRPLGELLPSSKWQRGSLLTDPQRLPVPSDTPPGEYGIELVTYEPGSGRVLDPTCDDSGEGLLCQEGGRLRLGMVQVELPAQPSGQDSKPLGRFDYIELVSAGSPAKDVRPGDMIPVELRWRAEESAYSDDYLVVLELWDEGGQPVGAAEGRPSDGRYPTSQWKTGYVVRDLREIEVPSNVGDGQYDLTAGLQRASDGMRVVARSGVFGLRRNDGLKIHEVTISSR
jgi:hypothetical protein